jgi:hypothetical protein
MRARPPIERELSATAWEAFQVNRCSGHRPDLATRKQL